MRSSPIPTCCAVLLVACGAVSGYAQAPTPSPDSVAAEFQTALRAMAWRAAAVRMHSEALDRFRGVIDMAVELDDSGATLEELFGDTSEEQYWAASPAEVFVVSMRFMAKDMPGLVHALVVREVEILGTATEPPHLAHVVYRSEARLSGAVPEVRVMTLKRAEAGWRVLETPELDVIREALRGIPRTRGASPPNQPSAPGATESQEIL